MRHPRSRLLLLVVHASRREGGSDAWRGGGHRHEAIVGAVEVTRTMVARFAERALGEALSVFPLTVVVQRIALESSPRRGA